MLSENNEINQNVYNVYPTAFIAGVAYFFGGRQSERCDCGYTGDNRYGAVGRAGYPGDTAVFCEQTAREQSVE